MHGSLATCGGGDLATWTYEAAQRPSDYTGMDVYYRSIQQRQTDLLTVHNYLWRWDRERRGG